MSLSPWVMAVALLAGAGHPGPWVGLHVRRFPSNHPDRTPTAAEYLAASSR